MLERVRQILADRQRRTLPLEGLVPAAVLVPFVERRDGLRLLMEQRTQSVDEHKGQVSFPGGVVDEGDADAVATALRESWEEVGLRPEDVEVLGLLDDTRTVTGYRITPVVGQVRDAYPFRLSEREVARLLFAPWEMFMQRQGLQREVLDFDGQRLEVDTYPFEGTHIWGATARIIRGLVDLIEAQQMAGRG
ncbi:MAG: CoA pyrophosphatase [Deltaproteobacteria bacterium]|nr:CoA pyrophosphatase [Deltaproteobacteria bacterium]